MKAPGRCWMVLTAFLFAFVPLAVVTTGSLAAQTEEEGPEFELINEWDLGFERSDLGNVAQTARAEYAEGNRNLAQARKLRGRIDETQDADKRAKLEEKLEETFQSAAGSFADAIGYAPKMAEAYAGLGETLREWGKLDKSLEVCAAAVRRFPDDLENFEGWAMTLMELNMLGQRHECLQQLRRFQPGQGRDTDGSDAGLVAAKAGRPWGPKSDGCRQIGRWIQQQGGRLDRAQGEWCSRRKCVTNKTIPASLLL